MRFKFACFTIVSVLACAGIAGAWGLPSLNSLTSTPSSSLDPDAFLARAQKSEALIDSSADMLFKAVASKEEQARLEEMQKKMAEATDDKEKNALRDKITESEMATIEKQAKSKEVQEEARKWDDKKKKMVGNAFFNFSLGALQAAQLAPEGSAIVKSISSSPSNAIRYASKLGSITESVKSIGGVLSNSAKVIGAMKPLMSAANIEIKAPATATDKPVDASKDI